MTSWRDDHVWNRDRLVVDTAASEVNTGVRSILGRAVFTGA
jgi:hypothetical protein